jgi:hypothetical protein
MGFIREVCLNPVETAANTFTQSAITLSSYFTETELRQGVVPVAAECNISAQIALSAASKKGWTMVTITKRSKTAMPEITDKDVLYMKLIEQGSGAAAGTINFITAREFPGGCDIQGRDLLFKDRCNVIDKDQPDTSLYWQVQGGEEASFPGHGLIIYFYVAAP